MLKRITVKELRALPPDTYLDRIEACYFVRGDWPLWWKHNKPISVEKAIEQMLLFRKSDSCPKAMRWWAEILKM